jgi:hypothetical protein
MITYAAINNKMYNCQHPGNSYFTHLDEVHFTYRKITWPHEVSSTSGSDDWRAPVVQLRFIATNIGQLCWSMLFTPLQISAYVDPLLRAVTLRPQLAYLAHRINQRIFQNLSVPKIISQVLEEHSIQGNAYAFQTGSVYPERIYCVDPGKGFIWQAWVPLGENTDYLEFQIWYPSRIVSGDSDDRGNLYQVEISTDGSTEADGLSKKTAS